MNCFLTDLLASIIFGRGLSLNPGAARVLTGDVLSPVEREGLYFRDEFIIVPNQDGGVLLRFP